MKRWLSDRLLWRVLLLAVALGALAGLSAWFAGQTSPVREGVIAACGVMAGAAAMRLWTWRDKP